MLFWVVCKVVVIDCYSDGCRMLSFGRQEAAYCAAKGVFRSVKDRVLQRAGCQDVALQVDCALQYSAEKGVK